MNKMKELTFEIDQRGIDAIKQLMKHFNVKSKEEMFSKAISILKIIAHINNTEGELIARKGSNETKIITQ